MKIEDLAELVKNRLTNFELARDYARMNGNLEALNQADKEIVALEGTLYQLNLLVDVSKSDVVKESTLTEAITDGSVTVLDEYDITVYATDPYHERRIMTILSSMPVMGTVEQIDQYITKKYPNSPVTGTMIMSGASAYDVDVRLMMAIMEQDSRFGTAGVAVRTLNPGNVGNTDDGSTRTYDSWQAGVTDVAEWLNRHRGKTYIPSVAEIEGTEEVVIPEPEPEVPEASAEVAPDAVEEPIDPAPEVTEMEDEVAGLEEEVSELEDEVTELEGVVEDPAEAEAEPEEPTDPTPEVTEEDPTDPVPEVTEEAGVEPEETTDPEEEAGEAEAEVTEGSTETSGEAASDAVAEEPTTDPIPEVIGEAEAEPEEETVIPQDPEVTEEAGVELEETTT